jgi:hypothetical protein
MSTGWTSLVDVHLHAPLTVRPVYPWLISCCTSALPMPDAAPVTSAFGAMAPKARVLLEEVAYARQAVLEVSQYCCWQVARAAAALQTHTGSGKWGQKSLRWQNARVCGPDDIMGNG